MELNYRSASEASQRLEEQQTHVIDESIEATLELEVDDVVQSDEELDESEEVVWSDDNYGGT